MSAPLRLGLAGLGSMGRNHLRVISNHPETTLAAVADPDPAVLAAAVAQTEARGYADPLAMIDGGRDRRPRHRRPDDGPPRARPGRDRARLAGPRREAARRHGRGRARHPDGRTRDAASASRSATWSDTTPPSSRWAACCAAGWLSTIYAITSRRAGPFPARIRDVGVTVDLGTHDVDMLCWIAGERPVRVYAETAQRIHATHEDLTFGLMHFPSGATGFLDVDWLTPAKRRSLVAVGEEGMFELDYLTQKLTFTRSNVERPQMIRGYATTFSGDVADIPITERRAAASPARRVRACPANGRAALRGRRGRPVGRRHGQRPADRGGRTPPHRPLRPALEAFSRMTIVSRPIPSRQLPGRLDQPAGQPLHPRNAPGRQALDRRARHGRAGRRRGRRQDGPAAGRAVREPRLAGHRRGRQPRGRGGRSTKAGPTSRRSRDWPTEWRAAHAAGPPGRHRRRGRRGPRRGRRRADRAGHARRRAAAGLPLHGRGGRTRSPPASTPGLTVIFETTLPVGDTRGRFAPRLEAATGLTAESDFFVAFSPERLFSGARLREPGDVPQAGRRASGPSRAGARPRFYDSRPRRARSWP